MKRKECSIELLTNNCRWKNARTWLLGLLVVGAVALAWVSRFVQDDAFISFRYAQNLALGNGLVWNIGERMEGYTNFLWTLCMVPAFWLNIDVVSWAYGLSMVAFVVTLFAVAYLARQWVQSFPAVCLAIILLATNASFLGYATGGLETQFGIAWIMLSICFLSSSHSASAVHWCIMAASLCSAFAFMTRMDSGLILLPFWVVALWRNNGSVFFSQRHGGTKITQRTTIKSQISNLKSKILFLSLLPGALLVCAWLLWRHHYYGAWVPNTFLIKGHLSPLRGLFYVSFFYGIYGLWLFLPYFFRPAKNLLVVFGSRGRSPSRKIGEPLEGERPRKPYGTMFISILLWHIYLVMIGGDFMEFRLLMPTLPLVVLLIVEVTRQAYKPLLYAITAVLIAVSFFVNGYCRSDYPGMFTRAELMRDASLWRQLGKEMKVFLGENYSSVKIGVTSAGAIPFETQMPTLDLLGLNNREVAQTGLRITPLPYFGNRPGHLRMAKWETVVASGVNLLINYPYVVKSDSPVFQKSAQAIATDWIHGASRCETEAVYSAVTFTPNASDPPISVVAWPLLDGRYWQTIYVVPSPIVDEQIRRTGARVIR